MDRSVFGAVAVAALPLLAGCGGEEDASRLEIRATGEGAAAAAAQPDSCSVWTERRGIIGAESPKILEREDGSVAVWAGGEEPGEPGAQWYDFTDSPIPAEELQYGIGKDRIQSIDDPVFTEPDDPRLLDLPPSPYRPCERPRTNDEIMVIGYVVDGRPRAYPTALLDRHEIVNDETPGRGKPFTVGW